MEHLKCLNCVQPDITIDPPGHYCFDNRWIPFTVQNVAREVNQEPENSGVQIYTPRPYNQIHEEESDSAESVNVNKELSYERCLSDRTTYGHDRPTYSNGESVTGGSINYSSTIYSKQGHLEWTVCVPNNEVLFPTNVCSSETSHGFPNYESFSDMDCVSNIACQLGFDKDNPSNPVIPNMSNKDSDCTNSESISNNMMYEIPTLGSIQRQAGCRIGHSKLQEIKPGCEINGISSETLFVERSQISVKDYEFSNFESGTQSILIQGGPERMNFSTNRDAEPKVTKQNYKCNADEKSVKENNKLTQICGKAYECGHCGKKFTHPGSLKRHEKIHMGIKQYNCNVCEKSFFRKENMQKHTLTHTGEKPYECVICRKKFSDPSTLRNHKLIHTGEKPYECVICRKKFSDPSTLRIHKKTHTGLKQ